MAVSWSSSSFSVTLVLHFSISSSKSSAIFPTRRYLVRYWQSCSGKYLLALRKCRTRLPASLQRGHDLYCRTDRIWSWSSEVRSCCSHYLGISSRTVSLSQDGKACGISGLMEASVQDRSTMLYRCFVSFWQFRLYQTQPGQICIVADISLSSVGCSP